MRFGSAVPFVDQVLDAPRDVVLHLLAPLAVARIEELLAVAGGAAEVRHQHRVPAIGEELRHRIVAPVVARPRSAVRHHQRGQSLRRQALRQRQVGRNLQPVGRLVADRLHATRAHRACNFSRTLYCSVNVLRLAVEEVDLAGLGVAGCGDQPELLVAVREATPTSLPGNFVLQPLVVGFEGLVLEVAPRLVVDVVRLRQFVGDFGEDAPRRNPRASADRIPPSRSCRSPDRAAPVRERSVASPLLVSM